MKGLSCRESLRRIRRGRCVSILVLGVAAVGVAARVDAAIGVSLEASPAAEAPVGTMVRWKGQVTGGSADLWYRFRVREGQGRLRMVRDFGPLGTLDWTSLEEGTAEIELTVRDRVSLETAITVSSFRFATRVAGPPVVNPTSHPLVFLFSSPGCDVGRASVRFESAGGLVQHTPDKPCVPGLSLNFYLAGLAPHESYTASLVVDRLRDQTVGPVVTFATGGTPFGLSPEVLQSAAPAPRDGFLLQTPLRLAPFATDLDGNLVWYGPSDITYMTRPEEGGTFFAVVESSTDPARDLFRKFDLVGMTVLETNAARASEQLVAMGKRPITGFHHEVRTISGGRILVLAGVEQILTDVQGPGPVDVVGDMIVVFDADLRVIWSWDAFDHLDASRQAVLGEECTIGCTPFYLAATANDWTHSNSVAETPDGALLLSIRHQDWVLKIDYAGGAGSGDVIWRLGKDGDFTFDSTDPYPWFSHQHDAEYEAGAPSTISVFDNGNTRVAAGAGTTSRGQVIELDEANRIARFALNADLGIFSFALGSAQGLAGGDYLFGAGYEPDSQVPSGGVGYALEVDGAGKLLSSMKLEVPVYRSFRVQDLYGATGGPVRAGTRVVDFRE